MKDPKEELAEPKIPGYEDETVGQREERIKVLRGILEINKSGYAGMMPNGNIVDRRKFPEAIPIPENPLFNVPKPKKLPK